MRRLRSIGRRPVPIVYVCISKEPESELEEICRPEVQADAMYIQGAWMLTLPKKPTSELKGLELFV